jgi:hypothetical protein
MSCSLVALVHGDLLTDELGPVSPSVEEEMEATLRL